MRGPLHYFASEKPDAAIGFESSMKEIIAEETSSPELRIKRAALGIPSALFIGGSVIGGVELYPHITETLNISLHPQNLETVVAGAKEAATVVTGLGIVGLCGWLGLEFGDLALRSHQRLQSLHENHSN